MKDIDDSELLEMMDVCDQDSTLNPPTQQPSTTQVTEVEMVFFVFYCFCSSFHLIIDVRKKVKQCVVQTFEFILAISCFFKVTCEGEQIFLEGTCA